MSTVRLKCKKIKLKDIFIDSNTNFSILNDAINRSNILTIYVYQLLRLWIIHKYESTGEIQPLKKSIIICAFKVFTINHKLKKDQDNQELSIEKLPIEKLSIKELLNCPEDNKLLHQPIEVNLSKKRLNKDNVDMYNELNNFYKEHFKDLINENTVSGKNLSHIIPPLATEMITNIENNIKMNFFNYIRRFVNSNFKQYNLEQQLNVTGTELAILKETLNKNLCTLKNDILSEDGDIKSTGYYLEWLNKYKSKILPVKPDKISYYDDLILNPYKYLKYMINMNKILEEFNLKQYQVFPLRTTYVKKNIHLETSALIDLFMENKNEYFKDIVNNKKTVWNKLFKLNNQIFKGTKYVFDYRISTNGYSCSLLFIHSDDQAKNEKRKANIVNASKKTNNSNKGLSDDEIKEEELKREKLKQERKEKLLKEKSDKKIAFKSLPKVEKKRIIEENKQLKMKAKSEDEFNKINRIEFPYIDELPQCLIDELILLHKIYIDPGKRDLLKMLGDNGKYFTYSSAERKKETKSSKYKKKLLKYKKNNGIIKLETEMSNYRSKSVISSVFKDYIRNYNEIIVKIKENIRTDIFEKLKWFGFINKKRSEDNLLNKIETVYGKNSIIIIGDWSISKQMRNFISTPMISLKRVLRRRFKVYNIDEFRTSILYYKTNERCKNLYVPNKKNNPYLRKVHSVLTYKMENNSNGYINRDKNSVNNIKKISESILKGNGRPYNFLRSTDIENIVVTKNKTANHNAQIDMGKLAKVNHNALTDMMTSSLGPIDKNGYL
jgi:hypothetical protein